MDNARFAIEKARLNVLVRQRDEAKAKGQNNRYADLVREVQAAERRVQDLLARR